MLCGAFDYGLRFRAGEGRQGHQAEGSGGNKGAKHEGLSL